MDGLPQSIDVLMQEKISADGGNTAAPAITGKRVYFIFIIK